MRHITPLSFLALALLLIGAGCTGSTTAPAPASSETDTEPNTAVEQEHMEPEDTRTNVAVNQSAGIQVTCPDTWSCTEHQFDLITAQKGGAVASFVVNDTNDVAAEHAAQVENALEPPTSTKTATLLAEGDAGVSGGKYALIQVESTTGRKEVVMVVTKPSIGGPALTCIGSYDMADQEEIARDMKALCESVDTVQ